MKKTTEGDTSYWCELSWKVKVIEKKKNVFLGEGISAHFFVGLI